MMKEAANSLLKILEEPPDTVHIIILAENPGELLPTIRSRCATVRLGALPVEEIEMLLADRRPDVPAASSAPDRPPLPGSRRPALAFDLEAYTAARADALTSSNAADTPQSMHRRGVRTTPPSSR